MKARQVTSHATAQSVEDIIACGMPSQQDLHDARANGVRTIVSLCPPAEHPYDEASLVSSLGMRYVNIPIAGAQDLTREHALRLAVIVDNPANRPLMVHCASGNRVGALFALKAFYSGGCDVEAALAAGRSAGLTELEPAVRAVMERTAARDSNPSPDNAGNGNGLKSNVDRLVFRLAGTFVLLSLLLAHFHSPNWLWFTAFVGGNMLQASFTGFCPLAKLLAWLGVPQGPAFCTVKRQG